MHVKTYFQQCKLRGKELPKHLERKGHRITRPINPCNGRFCYPGRVVEVLEKFNNCPECNDDELTFELRREARQDAGQEYQDIRRIKYNQ